MAATATRAKANAGNKKSASSSRRESGTQLQVRYFKRMKPNRIYGLTVAVPGGKKGRSEEDASGQIVVVRPVIAGAQVIPTEQRFEVAPGNQITFHVTPLGRGRLPRAHLEVFAPGQAPESIPLYMKVKTQRLAIFLLLMAWFVPMMMHKLTTGDWKPPFRKPEPLVISKPLEEELPPVPLVNQPAEWAPEGWKEFTITRAISVQLADGQVALRNAVEERRWLPNAVGAAFLLLAFFAWIFHDPKRKKTTALIALPEEGISAGSASTELQPI